MPNRPRRGRAWPIIVVVSVRPRGPVKSTRAKLSVGGDMETKPLPLSRQNPVDDHHSKQGESREYRYLHLFYPLFFVDLSPRGIPLISESKSSETASIWCCSYVSGRVCTITARGSDRFVPSSSNAETEDGFAGSLFHILPGLTSVRVVVRKLSLS